MRKIYKTRITPFSINFAQKPHISILLFIDYLDLKNINMILKKCISTLSININWQKLIIIIITIIINVIKITIIIII